MLSVSRKMSSLPLPSFSQILNWSEELSSLAKPSSFGFAKSLFKKKVDYSSKNYDAVVIGGGTGGLAFVQEARRQGLEVAVVNYVEPSPMGTTWGLGGTCVNVGCVPKKLMHHAGLLRSAMLMSGDYGWVLKETGEPIKEE